jgi:radical SAM superfamily enzyme YgiQ (UPF0313 family)
MIGWGERNFLEFGYDLLNGRLSKEPRVYRSPAEPEDFEKYLGISRYQKSLPPLELMRGCGYKCKYCQTGNSNPVYRKMASIKKYFHRLSRMRKRRVNFICSSPVNIKFISEIMEEARLRDFEFIEYGIFPSELDPLAITPGLLELLQDTVSNRSITLGIQCGSRQRLSELNRKYSINKFTEAISLINTYKFKANLDFIIGFPGETGEERQITLDFIRQLKENFIIHVQMHYFFPVSGSSYAFNFPSFISSGEKSSLLELTRKSVINRGWIQNEADAALYFRWLKNAFPDYYSRYHV